MALLSDFFLALDSELTRDNMHHSPIDNFPTLQTRGVDATLIAILETLITGEDINEVFGLLDPIIDFGPNGPWVIKVPDSLFGALQSLRDAAIDHYGQQWGATEEWGSIAGTQTVAQSLLQRLCAMARQAQSEGRQMYVWLSL